MAEVILAYEVDMATWRQAARMHIAQATQPDALSWHVLPAEQLFRPDLTLVSRFNMEGVAPLVLPRQFVAFLVLAFQAKDSSRFALFYRLVYRLVYEKHSFASLQNDTDMQALVALAAAVKQETLRFRAAFSAQLRRGLPTVWQYEPEHYCVEANAKFCRALAPRPWGITTPYRSMKWDGQTLLFGAPSTENQWQPDGQGAWSGYPNTTLVPTYKEVTGAATLDLLRSEAMDCRACALWEPAQRTVFGEGPETARVMFVGEQPGDQEDKLGRPFVGPAGHVFDRALQEVGLKREDVYVTNAVKHFRFTWRGTHRLHQKPEQTHMAACRVWLEAEQRMVRPTLIVMLGATAAQTILKRPITISRERSRLFELEPGVSGLVTVHPSYLLRLQNETDKEREYARFTSDLKMAAQFVGV